MRLLTALPLAAGLLALTQSCILGAESPSAGIVEAIEAAGDNQVVVVRFDAQAAAKRLPGEMVALYAPGAVEKHPLTGQVIVARPVLAAKIQLTQVVGRIAGAVRWTATGAKLATGMDAIPLPGEPAPNAAPALTGAVQPQQAPGGSALNLNVPVADHERDPLISAWILEGPRGRSGRLLARTTGGTSNAWIAPLVPGNVEVQVRVGDPLGQECQVQVPLTSTAGYPAPKTLKPLARWGLGLEPALGRLERDAAGTWWGLAEGGQPQRIQAGWLTSEALALPQDQLPRRGIALQIRGDELHVLDADKGRIIVFGTDSTVRRTYGSFDKPTDLALAPDGTAFVADQAAGGIEIIEPDGSYRGRLGRSRADGWQTLVAVATDLAGDLYALDQTGNSVTHYDRFQRRVESWTIPNDPKDPPVDLAVHPTRGVLVLYTNGRLVAVGPKGAVEAAQPLLNLGIDPGPARSLAIDQLGEVITCHTAQASLVRYDANLQCTGVRAERTRTQTIWTADGRGHSYGLDPDLGLVTAYDPEGWAIARYDLEAKGGGMFGPTLDLAVDPAGTHLWVSDSKKPGVHHLDLERTASAALLGSQGENNGQFQEPVAMAVDESGRVYVVDAELYRVQVFDAAGVFLFAFGQKGKGQGELYDPERITVSPAGDAAYVYDSYANELKKWTLDQAAKSARHVTNGGGKGNGPGQLRKVSGLACDRSGLLYALDSSRGDLQAFDFRGNACMPVFGATLADLGAPKDAVLSVAPDGQVGLHGGGRAVWLRW